MNELNFKNQQKSQSGVIVKSLLFGLVNESRIDFFFSKRSPKNINHSEKNMSNNVKRESIKLKFRDEVSE